MILSSIQLPLPKCRVFPSTFGEMISNLSNFWPTLHTAFSALLWKEIKPSLSLLKIFQQLLPFVNYIQNALAQHAASSQCQTVFPVSYAGPHISLIILSTDTSVALELLGTFPSQCWMSPAPLPEALDTLLTCSNPAKRWYTYTMKYH